MMKLSLFSTTESELPCKKCPFYNHSCNGCNGKCIECEKVHCGTSDGNRLSINMDSSEIQNYYNCVVYKGDENLKDSFSNYTPEMDFYLPDFVISGPSRKTDLVSLYEAPYNIRYFCNSLAQRIRTDGSLGTDNMSRLKEYIEIDKRTRLIISLSIDDKYLNSIWEHFYNGKFILQVQKLNPYLVLAPNFGPTDDMPGLEKHYNFERNQVMWREMIDNGIKAIPCIFYDNEIRKIKLKNAIDAINPPWVYMNFAFYRSVRDRQNIFAMIKEVDGMLNEGIGIIVTGVNDFILIKAIKDSFPNRKLSFFLTRIQYIGLKNKQNDPILPFIEEEYQTLNEVEKIKESIIFYKKVFLS